MILKKHDQSKTYGEASNLVTEKRFKVKTYNYILNIINYI